MRAGHRDVLIERGTTWRLAVAMWAADGTTKTAGELVAGDHVMYDGKVHIVSTVTANNGTRTIVFDRGLWSDPSVTVKADAVFAMAVQTIPTAVRAAYEYDYPVVVGDDGVETGGPLIVDIPSAVGVDGTIVLTLTVDATRELPDGCGVWDLTVQQPTSAEWVRLLEGQFSAIPTVSAPLPGATL
jgi:hypothetical protein